jgi:hypothetical protein
MKRIIVVTIILLGLSILKSDAQYVRVKPGFSVGISIGAPGPAPYAGAIWIGPEWAWRGGRYVEVPGYWERPHRHHYAWIPGHWRYAGRGYRWVPGHWR